MRLLNTRPLRRSAHAVVVAVIALVGLVVVADPALAVHRPYSEGIVPRRAASQNYVAPNAYINLHDLGACPAANAKAQFTVQWKVSNVTRTSVYIDTLTIKYTPGSNGSRILGAHLVDGNGRTLWSGNWGDYNVGTSGKVKVFYFRRTVNFGRDPRGFHVIQWFGFNTNAGAVCDDNQTVYFYLRPRS